ncbi:unnamed protein product [Alopecurus aequalis]
MAAARALALILMALCALVGAGRARSMSSGTVASTLNARLKNPTDAFAREKEWNNTVNFSSDSSILLDCMKEDMKKNYVRPNKNCNLTSSVDSVSSGGVALRTTRGMSRRCQCPFQDARRPSLPFWSIYCPQSTMNKTTGVCGLSRGRR